MVNREAVGQLLVRMKVNPQKNSGTTQLGFKAKIF